MTVSADSFRTFFGQVFIDAAKYPDLTITQWIAIAGMMLNQRRWGPPAATDALPLTTKIDLGTMFFVAHQIVLEKQAADAAARGATPGVQKGAVSNDSAGPVSRGYDTSAGLELEAGHWNLTVYGTRFIALAKMVSAGGLVVNGSCPPPLSGPAWPGPPPFPGWFG